MTGLLTQVRCLRVCFPLILLFVACIPLFSAPVQTPTIPQEGKPAYTLAQAQAIVREVLPLIEQAAGRTFKSPPKVKLVTRQQFTDVLASDLLVHMRLLTPPDQQQQLPHDARVVAGMLAMSFLGKYGLTDHTLYLLPGNLLPILTKEHVAHENQQALMKLIIAHELTHALHDQQLNLTNQLAQADTLEKTQALNATMEGFAMYVGDQVADKLQLNEAAKTLARFISLGKDAPVKPARTFAQNSLNSIVTDIYLGGRDFIAWHAQHGGMEQVWQVLAAPPVQTRMVLHPETYSAHPAKSVDYAKVLDGLADRFGKHDWQVQNMALGELALRALYAELDPATRDKVLANIEHAQALIGAGPEQTICNLSLFILQDPALAGAHITAVEKLAQAKLDKLTASKLATVKDVNIADFPAIQADIARKLTFTVVTNGAILHTDLIRVVRGNVLLEIYTQQLSLTDEAYAEIAEEVFSRVKAATVENAIP